MKYTVIGIACLLLIFIICAIMDGEKTRQQQIGLDAITSYEKVFDTYTVPTLESVLQSDADQQAKDIAIGTFMKESSVLFLSTCDFLDETKSKKVLDNGLNFLDRLTIKQLQVILDYGSNESRQVTEQIVQKERERLNQTREIIKTNIKEK